MTKENNPHHSNNRPGGYVLITPCRDEAQFVRFTVDSVMQQTVLPALWVLVDDGSTDGTGEILDELAAEHPFIRVIHRTDRGHRHVGPGVIDAFYAGLQTINMDDFDYLCKFDVDLLLPTVYFEKLIGKMKANPRLGTCSGKPYFVKQKPPRLTSEKCGDEMSVGMTKFYRVSCFKEIGGFVRGVMWDGIDCHRCRMLGWKARSWDEPDLQFIHMRPMGSSYKGILTGRIRHGAGQYFMGTSLLYLTASCIFRLSHRPLVIGSLASWWGFVSSMLTLKPRYEDLEFRKFLRAFQWDCLLRGKGAATKKIAKTHIPKTASQHSKKECVCG